MAVMAAQAATHDKLELGSLLDKEAFCFNSLADRDRLPCWRMPWLAAGAAMTVWGTPRFNHKLEGRDPRKHQQTRRQECGARDPRRELPPCGNMRGSRPSPIGANIG